MGVHGLWRLIEPSGKTVPVETLENKVLAVDVSIWLHQAVKGFQDSRGQPLPNAHLLGIFHRVCKLLYFRVKPVFVFDGGVPVLKKQTIAKRNQQKAKNFNATGRIHKQLLSTLLKHSAVNKVLSEKAKASIEANCEEKSDAGDMFVLPPQAASFNTSSEDSDFESESTIDSDCPSKNWDIHSIDMESADFRSLPADVRHEILTEVKETRKQSSWGRLHELPTESGDFATFQLNRLRKRYQVQVELEEAEKEMGGHSLSLMQLEQLLNDQGVITNKVEIGKRIASDENTRYLLIKDVKKAIEDAKQGTLQIEGSTRKTKADSEFEDDMRRAIQLSKEQEGKEDVSEDIAGSLETLQKVIDNIDNSKQETIEKDGSTTKTKADLEFEDDIRRAIELSKEQERKKDLNEDFFGTSETFQNVIDDTKEEAIKKERSVTKIKADSEFKDDMRKAIELSVEQKVKKDVCEDIASTSKTLKKVIDDTKQKTIENEGSKTNLEFEGNIMKAIQLSKQQKDVSTLEGDSDLQKAIILSLECESSSSSSDLEDNVLASAKNYMMEYSGLTPAEIAKIIGKQVKSKKATNKQSIASGSISVKTKDEIFAIAEDSDSDSSDNLIEVSNMSTTNEATGLEIVINPTDTLEDDLFSDIFDDNVKNLDRPISDNEQQLPEVITVDDSSETVKNKTEIKNVSSDEVAVEKQKTVNVIREMLKNVKDSEKEEEVTIAELKQIQKNLSQESKELQNEKATKERMASNITDQMYQEAQELLELFGVPYVIAPMEAEAQCAFLDKIGLTDGTITDDSDIWLFGGKTVYKNFFNQSKHVMEFKAENIQHCFKLTREQMVLLALLVGSDYTTGVQGVGPVTALEILAAFPFNKNQEEIQLSHNQLLSGLAEFRKWYYGKATKGPSRNSLRKKLKNLVLSENFPSLQVVQAYLDPQVETSKEAFSWAKPDVVSLIDFAKQKFGWTRTKSEEILMPVLKRLEERFAQTSILNYFKTKRKIDSDEHEKCMSKRVKKALDKIGKSCDKDNDSDEELKGISKKKRAERKSKTKDNQPESSKQLEQDVDIKVLQQTKTRSRRRLALMEEEAKEKLQEEKVRKTRISSVLHTKEVIIQKELDKKNLLKSKLKAIEVFRKSKQGPGYVKKRQKKALEPKEDAELSESDSD